jgi:pilus assembly protein FimV
MAAGFWSLCCFVPLNVAALGVGDIVLESALNQPFSAEIPFESYVESDFDGLSVQLASDDTFKRYGLDLPRYLKDFDFTVADGAAGRPVIRVTSARPVAEPFVTLLLDIKWASGRLLREYTVLLDPPVFEGPGPASAPATAVAGRDTAPRSPAQSRGRVERNPAVAAVANPPGRDADAPSPAPRAVAPAALTEGTYSVQRRDTLWSIAQRVSGGSSVTVNQAMLALYNANPEAFLGNINLLKAGAILRIPDAGDLAAISAGAATAAVREQNQQFAGGAAAAAPARLELRVPGEAGSDAAGGDPAAAGAGNASSARELTTRIEQLESELSESRRLLDMKDAELAALQRRVAEQGDAEAAALLEGDVPVDDTPLADLSGDTVGDESSLVTDDAAGEAVFADESAADAGDEISSGDAIEAPAAAPAPAVQRAPQPEPSFISQLLSSVWLWVTAGVVLLLALFLVRRRKPAEQDPFATGAGFSTTDTAAADGAGATLRDIDTAPGAQADAIIVEEGAAADDLRDFGKDLSAAEPDEDPAYQTARLDDMLDFDADAESKAAAAQAEKDDKETGLEKTISTGAPLNLDQADPIAEAEFHMAYGLYDQAADLLERALDAEPENRAYRVKLLEVYFVWENRDGFLKQAQILRDATADDSNADWNKVVILGKQLCPDDALFAGAVTTAPDAAGIDLEFVNDSGETDLDFTLGGNEVEALDPDLLLDGGEAGAGKGSDDDALDFDLGAEFGGSDDVEFDLSDAGDDLDAGETPTIEATVRDEGVVDLSDLADDDATQETPTVESFIDDNAATMESPAISSDAASTMETPTLENPMNEPTVESPTLESLSGGGETTEMPALDMDDLDPDALLAELEADAEDAGGTDDLDVDLSGLTAGDDDATMLAPAAGDPDDALTELVPSETASDTVEQPQIDVDELQLGDTAEQPAIGSDDMLDLDLGLDDGDDGDDDMATVMVDPSLPEDATMTEVGTKLDLARAYIDMGDPDGARSILGEVLDEGAAEQQQEARQMLAELGD